MACSLTYVSKMRVLSISRSKNFIKRNYESFLSKKHAQVEKKTLRFICKKCKLETLLMVNLPREWFPDPRNPAEPCFPTGGSIGSHMHVCDLTYENPNQQSCWGNRRTHIWFSFNISFNGPLTGVSALFSLTSSCCNFVTALYSLIIAQHRLPVALHKGPLEKRPLSSNLMLVN